jgi:virginiamycin A acetyltransferase
MYFDEVLMPMDKSVLHPDPAIIFPKPGEKDSVYLKNVIKNPRIIIGEYTIHHDFHDPTDFETENVLYLKPENDDKLIIGKYVSIASGVKFIMNGANHKMGSFATFPFPVVADNWGLDMQIEEAWDIEGDTVIGNDVWLGFESVIMPGIHVGDGAIIATRSLVTKDVPPFTIVGGVPARVIKKRFNDDTIEFLQKLKWWDWDVQKVKANVTALMNGDVEKLKKLLS